MRRAANIALLAFSACVLSSCVTTLDGAWLFGRVNDVSVEDIRAAIAADIRAHPALRSGKLNRIDVVSTDEIHLYWAEYNVYGGCNIIKRIQGRWEHYGGIVVTSRSKEV